MTDNGVTAKPGDGLWQTATMVSADSRLDVADRVSKTSGTSPIKARVVPSNAVEAAFVALR